MPVNRIEPFLEEHLKELEDKGTLKGKESVITGIKKGDGSQGPRYYVEGYGDKEFLKMNSNSYLGMSLVEEVIEAEDKASREFGAGPGAVRFINGTYKPHVDLEKKLAEFHEKEDCMILSSAYLGSMSALVPLITNETLVISDELNHNCIINAIRLARPGGKAIYQHLDYQELEKILEDNAGKYRRVIVVTDGVFSMRGDYVDMSRFQEICEKYHHSYPEGLLTVIDDSHGVGALGETGRGTEEFTNGKADIVVGTMGKAFGVNGGYVTTSFKIVEYLRETTPFYIYSNPLTPAEASACLKAVEILDSSAGKEMLKKLRQLTQMFDNGLRSLGYETIPGEHPVVPLMIRDTSKTEHLVGYLFNKGVLATGLKYPVVPRGDEKIRFQIAANHTEADLQYVLDVLKEYREQYWE